MILQGLYTILLGLFLAFFVGIGINTFYPEPIYNTPTPCMAPIENGTVPVQIQRQCEKDQMKIQEKSNAYTQVVSSVALIAAVIFMGISFLIFRNQQVFSYGFLFGSMFTLLYSLGRSLNSHQPAFTFTIVFVSLALVMLIGYLRFVKKDSGKKK